MLFVVPIQLFLISTDDFAGLECSFFVWLDGSLFGYGTRKNKIK